MGRKILALALALSVAVSVSSISVLAKEIEKRDPDGTLILKKYPVDENLTSKKKNIAELHLKMKKGLITKDVVDSAMKDYFLSQGDVVSASQVGKTEDAAVMSAAKREKELAVGYLQETMVSAAATSNYIYDLIQQPQQKNYYCGCSTVASILGSRQVTKTQSTLSSNTDLQTEKWNGTPWYVDATTKYVVANVLNKYLNTSYYTATAAPSEADLKIYVMHDIDNDWGIAANMSLSTKDPRPSCYPSNRTIGHWIALEGYSNDGNTIRWAEPVYNAPTVSWYKNVTTAYPSDTSSLLASMFKNRGIIW